MVAAQKNSEAAPPIVEVDDGASAQGLKGRLGVGSIVFSVVAFAAPLLVVVGLMPSVIGFAGYAIVPAYTMIMLIVLLFAFGYATMTRYVNRPGAFYAYITAGLGRRVGLGGAFVALFGYLLLALPTWIAFGVYVWQLVTGTFHGPDIPWYVWALVGAALTGIFSYRHIEFSAKVLGVALGLEVLLVIAFDTVAFIDGGPGGIPVRPLTVGAVTDGGFGLALLFGMLCFIGFESAAIYREEAKDPEKTVPRATYLSVILIGVFYVIAAWAFLTALGPDGVAGAAKADPASLFGETAARYLGTVLPDVIKVLVITSTFACLLAQHNTISRYGFSLGKDGVFPSRFGAAHPRHHSPHIASMVVTALTLVTVFALAAVTGFENDGTNAFTIYIRTNGLGAMIVIFLMCLVSIAIIAYFAKNRVDTPARVWKTVVAPILGLIGLLIILVLSVVHVDTLIGAGETASLLMTLLLPVVLIAGIAYASHLARAKPDIFTRIGRQ
ncbi:APC family permease [Streptomyces sp. Inha503]|uniref:APC family permease n=1 Tax=Streptomyces sp. Inha503 TaxID=3383314 RepID=UPI0039A2987D